MLQGDHWIVRPETRTWRCPPVDPAASRFHAGLPGYAMTPLVEVPDLATELNVRRVFVKDESSRFGLPAFKILGVSWATFRAIAEHAGQPVDPPTLEGLGNLVASLPPLTLVTATDGNHGRALARFANLIGASSEVYVPAHLPSAVIEAIEREGVRVERIEGSYDEAVRMAAARADENHLLIQDTAWPGYEAIPGWTVEGYSTLFHETDLQLHDAGIDTVDLVSVPTGVGSLLQAALQHFRREGLDRAPAVLAVEPDTAACVQASVRAGHLASVTTSQTVMAGLNCETPSSLVLPFIEAGLDASVAVSDDEARLAMDNLTRLGIAAGPSGSASLAGVRRLLADPQVREALGLTSDTTLLLISTEGRASGAA